MGVLFVTSKSLGGSGKHITALAEGLRPWVRCELAYFPSGVAQDSELESPFSRVHHFPRKPSFDPGAIAADVAFTARLLAQGGYEAVHTHTSLGGLIGRVAARVCRAPVQVIHTLHAYGADEFTPVPQKWVYWAVEKALDRMTNRYVSPSHYTREYGRRTHVIDAAKARVIHNSLPLQPPSERASQRRRLRGELGLAEDETLFLFCGRFEKQKGVDVLLEAAARVAPPARFRLVLCGTGELQPQLMQQAHRLGLGGRVLWAGWQPDVRPYYAAADVFVMPSRWETFGLVFLEAMNYGLPILSTRTQAVPEVVEDGVCGLLSANEDANQLAANMYSLAMRADLREELGANGRRQLARFSYDEFLRSHLALYRECRVVLA
ncbi:glycosyltransferase family 4 protein [Ramlibacter humi]|uniref:Glycosyltransferase family 1 protein n=1 Tax=Ramlibacter humi TaxID=2530451 RepID=A0A4Z0BLJ9_9BURK|nr:glycosyltransferase family 4 protein [Ramlibacter humi]TFZ00196.1 glycosyltransferase family 1 protein [Ramlibacter humi]